MTDYPIDIIIKKIWHINQLQNDVIKKLDHINISNIIQLYFYQDYLNEILRTKNLRIFCKETLINFENEIEDIISDDKFKLLQFIKINWSDVNSRFNVLDKLKNIDINSFKDLIENIDNINELLINNNYKIFNVTTIEKIKIF